MKQGSRYYPLFKRLQASGEREIILTFTEIEGVLGAALPRSAWQSKAWWSNRGKGAHQSAAWMDAGYHVVAVDLDSGRVTFRKPIIEYQLQREGDTLLWNADAIKALRQHMGLNQAAFADVLGVRQQTVSEWENGVYAPTRATSRHLMHVAREAGFIYMDKTE